MTTNNSSGCIPKIIHIVVRITSATGYSKRSGHALHLDSFLRRLIEYVGTKKGEPYVPNNDRRNEQAQNDIAVNKPIPSHCGLKRGIFLKNTNADSYHGNADESADKTIKNIDKKAVCTL